jgi:5-formyltetrahydrofolate cyclo-ligase
MDRNSEKKRLRALQRSRLAAISSLSRARQQEQLCQALQDRWDFKAYPWILGFLALPDEPDLSVFWKYVLSKGRLALPRTLGEGLVFHEVVSLDVPWPAHPWGLREPPASFPSWRAQDTQKTLALVPGLAFDPLGNRLGRGGGYYDRFLNRFQRDGGLVWGVGWLECGVKELPILAHDVQLDAWVSP